MHIWILKWVKMWFWRLMVAPKTNGYPIKKDAIRLRIWGLRFFNETWWNLWFMSPVDNPSWESTLTNPCLGCRGIYETLWNFNWKISNALHSQNDFFLFGGVSGCPWSTPTGSFSFFWRRKLASMVSFDHDHDHCGITFLRHSVFFFNPLVI